VVHISQGSCPAPTARSARAEPPLIAVTAERITVDGTLVARTADVAAAGRVVRVDGVFDALKARRVAAREPEHSAVLRIDADVPAIVVKCVFQTGHSRAATTCGSR
jgi:hypothetical protein